MQRIATVLAIVGLVLVGVPGTALTDTLEDRNREWIQTKLGMESSEERSIRVLEDGGYEERPSTWLVDRLTERFTQAGVDLSTHSPHATDSHTETPDGFPVASTIMIIWEEAVVEDDDDGRRALAAEEDPEIGCNQGGGEAGGHYTAAEQTPEGYQDEIWEREEVGGLPPAFPNVEATTWYGAGSYDYIGTANSSLSQHGNGELMTYAPTLDATVTDQRISHETHFTYEDATVQYTGSSDFWCVEWEDWSGDFHVLNAPLIDGVITEVPSP